jgi:hypothetical protein
MAEHLSAAEARRIALAAQGFGGRRPAASGPPASVTTRHLRAMFDRLHALQLDSVNVVARSHELPAFSRLGPYDRALLGRLATTEELFEYWGHEASLLPVRHQPLFRWRMADAHHNAWSGLVELRRSQAGYVEAVLQEVAERGPLSAGELSDPGRRSGPWWGWNAGKQALEFLFWTGQVTARRRYPSFERVYDLTDRLLPAEVLSRPTPDRADAQRELLALAGTALGVATVRDLADYFRLKPAVARPLVADLVEAQRLVPVTVEGWKDGAFAAPPVAPPRKVSARALLSPFDSLIWERARTERIWGFRYRLEFYTPAPKRVYGYYVAPLLLGDRLVARADLKADRAASTLRVLGAFAEPGADRDDVAEALAGEAGLLAGWLALDRVEVTPRGDLGARLARLRP